MSAAASERRGGLVAIVLNYRTPDATVRAVESLLGSHRELDGLVVVDNGSGDGSADRLRAALPGATILESERNLGFSGGCNLAIAEANRFDPELVLLVNSDAVLAENAIQHLEDALTADRRHGIAGPVLLSGEDPARVSSAGIAFSTLTGRLRHHGFGEVYRAGHPEQPSGRRVVDAVSGCVMLVRREVFERIGTLDESYFFSFEDVDFCLKARRAGFSTVVATAALVRHEGSLSIGRNSARKLYFSTRNHLRAAARAQDSRFPGHETLRATWIVLLSLAFAMRAGGVPRLGGLRAVVLGTWHHVRGRYEDGP